MDLSTLTRLDLERGLEDKRNKLSRLEIQIDEIRQELASKTVEINVEAQKLKSSIGQYETELQKREARDSIVPTISDHALLRYMERVHGVDVEALKADLLTKALKNAVIMGASGYKTNYGTFVIKGAFVVTFLGKEQRAKKKTQRGMRNFENDGIEEEE